MSEYTPTLPGINAEHLFRIWQQNFTRALKAQERVMHGFTAAAALEWRYTQDYAKRRMGLLRSEGDMPNTAQAPLQEIEKLLTLSREVAEELRGSFTEAAQLLRETIPDQQELEEIAESPVKAAHRPPPPAAKAPPPPAAKAPPPQNGRAAPPRA